MAMWGNASPLWDAEGRVRGCVGAFVDITERKRTEEALLRSRDELEMRVQERTSELQNAKEELEVTNEELRIELEQHSKLEAELMKAKEAAEAGKPRIYELKGEATRRKIILTNDFAQAGERYHSLNKMDREHLLDNLIADLMHIDKPIQKRMIDNLIKADLALGRLVESGLKL